MLNSEGIAEELKRGSIYVDHGEENIGENQIKVTLGDTIKVYDTPALDITKSSPYIETPIPEDGFVLEPGSKVRMILKPNELYIGRTEEYTKTYGFVPLLQGTEELAALGMETHITAGFGDNGFEGTWTLEIQCLLPTIIHAHMLIGYISYIPLIGENETLYRGKYFGQVDPTTSRLSEEYTPARKREKDVK